MGFNNRSVGDIRTELMSSELLEKFPVWGGFDDDDSGMLRPVINPDPFLTDCDPLVIRATFQTPQETKLQGCIRISRTFDQVYMVDFFIGNAWFGFNQNLRDLAAEDLERLQEALKRADDKVFPVQFTTEMGTSADIRGVFSPFINPSLPT